MRDLVILFVHIIATLARLLGPGGIRSVVAESVLIKQQLLILNRSRSGHPICVLQIALLPVCVLS
jgi:putative transposase